MRRVLRQDPDVILIGEMRDEETVRTALSRRRDRPPRALHAAHPRRDRDDQPDHRLLPAAPPAAGAGDARLDAARASSASASSSAPTATGRVAVCEVLVVTGRVQDLILNPNETGKITEVIAEGEYYGMQTFDQALLKHVMAGDITEEVAIEAASSPHDFKLMLAAQGQRASGIEQVMANGADGGRRGPAGREPPALIPYFTS